MPDFIYLEEGGRSVVLRRDRTDACGQAAHVLAALGRREVGSRHAGGDLREVLEELPGGGDVCLDVEGVFQRDHARSLSIVMI
jgi:hypothetical protein